MDSKTKFLAGLIITCSFVYFCLYPLSKESTSLSSASVNESAENPNSLYQQNNVKSATSVPEPLFTESKSSTVTNKIDSLEKIPECTIDPDSFYGHQLQEELAQAKENIEANWHDIRAKNQVNPKQQVEYMLYGVKDSLSVSDKLNIFEQYLTQQPNDVFALSAAIHYCGLVKNNTACDGTVIRAVEHQKNGYLYLALAASKLKQKDYQTADDLIMKAIKQPAYNNPYLSNSRNEDQFLASNTNLPANKRLMLLGNSRHTGDGLFEIHRSCVMPQKQHLSSESCYQVGQYLSHSGNIVIDKMFGLGILESYHQDFNLEMSADETKSSIDAYLSKSAEYSKLFNYVIADERLLPTFFSENYDHSEQARMSALTEQLLDYFQDPDYQPCQKFNQ